MANEFNIRELVASAHYVGLPFPLLDLKNLLRLPDVEKLGKALIGKNIIGRPFFSDFDLDGVRLPNEPLITVNTRKIIEETVLVGNEHRGTVKEFISAGDYMIKIEGVCITPGVKEYPTEQVRSIIEICQKNEALNVENDIAELFNITKLVIKDYGFGNMKGKPFSQSYYINAVSDNNFFAVIDQLPN